MSASLLPLAGMAGAGMAQGACVHDWLFCTITQVCDGAGTCVADDTRVDFSLPASTGQDSAQARTICVDDMPVSVTETPGPVGSTEWRDGETVNRLLPAGRRLMVWMSTNGETPEFATQIRFMTCGMLE